MHSEIKNALFRFSESLGADVCGIAPSLVPISWAERHTKWLSRGYQADMHYLARSPVARYDARSLLAGCQSVIVIGVNYWQPDNGSAAKSPRVSRYAWGTDYHLVVGDKLRRIGQWLEAEVPGSRWKACVDHSPLGEKAFAIAAGLGWEGRNTLVLNPRYGSYFFLGLLLTTVAIEPDTPLDQDCGACNLCVKACPTSALLGPGILDARLCISYATTERKSLLGPDDKLHGWAYGCDDCQNVCPFNRSLEPTAEPLFARRGWLEGLSAQGESELDESSFNLKYEGTVIKRRRLERWRAQVKAASI